jgi:hypothetical protein
MFTSALISALVSAGVSVVLSAAVCFRMQRRFVGRVTALVEYLQNGVQQSLNEAHVMRDDARQGIARLSQAVSENAVSREELRPILEQLITREELDGALRTTVSVIARQQQQPGQNGQFTPVMAAQAQSQLASTLAGLNQQMQAVNEQLGING